MSRLPVKKTYKLYIDGAFPRSESGRTLEVERPPGLRARERATDEELVGLADGQPCAHANLRYASSP